MRVGLIAALGAFVALTPPAQAAAPPGPWDAFNLAPASRYRRADRGAQERRRRGGRKRQGVTTLGPNAYVTFDFGKEVGGFTRLKVAPGSAAPTAALTYSEWSTYASPTTSDASNGSSNVEPPVVYPAPAGATIDTGTTRPAPVGAGAVADRRSVDLGHQRRELQRPGHDGLPAQDVHRRRPVRALVRGAAREHRRRRDHLRQWRQGRSIANSFQTSRIVDVKPQLVAGTNVIAIQRDQRRGRPGGRARQARARHHRARHRRELEGEHDQEPAGWNTAGFDDSAWPNAFANGAYGAGPWGSFATIRTPAARARTRARR